MTAIKLLIFDFDGTLADTGKVIQLTIAQTLRKLNQAVPDAEELKRHIGLPLAKIFELVMQTQNQSLIDEAVRIYRAKFPENSKNCVSLYPGVRKTLNDFKKADFILAIASSREKNSLLALVNQLDITADFSIIAGEQDVTMHKPAPDIAEFVLQAAHMPASKSLFVGDTVFDISTGKAAGMQTCAVSYGNHSRQQLLQAGADYVIDNFTELKNIVNCKD